MKQQFKALFIDGGGTKTSAYLMNESEEILKCKKVESMSNLYVSETITKDSFKKIFDYFKDDKIDYIYISLAGFSAEVEEHKQFLLWLSETFNISLGRISANNDINFLAESLCQNEYDMVLIFGTGSSYAVKIDGKIKNLGGWGHIFGDEGSAYSFSKELIKRAIDEIDSGKITEITKFVMEYFKIDEFNKLKKEIYSTEQKSNIANLSSEFIRNNNKHEVDAMVNDILDSEIKKIINKLSVYINKSKNIYIDGGFAKNAIFLEKLEKEMGKKIKKVSWKSHESNPMFNIIKNTRRKHGRE